MRPAIAFQPAGFRGPFRAPVIPINRGRRIRRRGLGDVTVSQLQALQAPLDSSSADWRILQNLINDPVLRASSIGQDQLAGVLQTAAQGVQAQQNPTLFYTDPATGYTAVGTRSTLPVGATNIKVAGADLPGQTKWDPAAVQAVQNAMTPAGSSAPAPSRPVFRATPRILAAAPPASAPTAAGTSANCVPCLVPGPPPCCGSGGATVSTGLLSTTLLGFPLWIWGAALVGGYFLFFQGGQYGR